jgi:hypothetical protein
MMPRVALDSGAVDAFADLEDKSIESLFRDDDKYKNNQSEWRRSMMGSDDLASALDRDADRGGDQGQRDRDSGKRLGLAVPVRVVLIRRESRNPQTAPDD